MAVHHWSWAFIQATVAILILVGFESVTAMGGEAKNARRDIPKAVILSLLVQGLLCYLFEYFAANYFLNSGYTMANASGSAAPIGDMMVMIGDALLGPGGGQIFMLCEAVTVFLALIGTTPSCMSTGARVTYAMGSDEEVRNTSAILHGKKLTPHRAIWMLATISAVIGCVRSMMAFGDAGAPSGCGDKASLPQGFWSSFGYTTHDGMAASAQLAADDDAGLEPRHVPPVCDQLRHLRRGVPPPPEVQLVRHFGVPVFGLVANVACMVVLPGRSVPGLRHQNGAAGALSASPWSGASTAGFTSPGTRTRFRRRRRK